MRDGAFKAWEGENLLDWRAKPVASVVRVGDLPNGVTVIELADGGEEAVQVFQFLRSGEALAGRTMVMACLMKSDSNRAGIQVTYEEEGTLKKFGRRSEGGGVWRPIIHEVAIPEGVDRASLCLRIVRPAGSSGEVLVEAVEIRTVS